MTEKEKQLWRALQDLMLTALAHFTTNNKCPEKYAHRVIPLEAACDDAYDLLYPKGEEPHDEH